MDQTFEIPIFPLGSVLYPAGRLSLRIFEPRYVDMIMACMRDSSVFGVNLIRAGYEVGTPAIPYDTGCTARILECEPPQQGAFLLSAQGETAFRIHRRWTRDDGLIVAVVSMIEPPDPLPVPDRYEPLTMLLQSLMSEIGGRYFPSPHRFEDAAWVGNRLCELLPVAPERKQALLELNDPLQVLDEVVVLMKQLRDEH
jgi:Lon protease-like protein